MTNRFVVKTIYENQTVYYHTVTKHIISIDCTDQELKENLFLEGQERESIEAVLLGSPEILYLTVIPTWECNLRCSHCSVLTLLKKEDPDRINIKNLIKFTEDWLNKFSKTKYLILALLGGEPLLRTDDCLEIVKEINKIKSCLITLTTNLTTEITDKTLELFDLCCEVGVSLDGNKEEHNWQRKSISNIEDPWQITYDNLKILVEHGFRDKIKIKAALRDQNISKDKYQRFLESLASIGLDLERITYGIVHPTNHHQHLDTPHYTDYILKRIKLNPVPCCKFRIQNQFHVEPNGNLYDAYFGYARELVGNTKDKLEEILEKKKEIILKTFPIFNDPGCSDCPVVGYCWGGCQNSRTLVKDRPSQFCNRVGLTEHVKKLTENGNLIKADRGENPVKFCEREEKRFSLL